MVERITDPHKPVHICGYNRLPDNYAPPARGGVVTTIAVCTVIVVALMAAGIAGVWS